MDIWREQNRCEERIRHIFNTVSHHFLLSLVLQQSIWYLGVTLSCTKKIFCPKRLLLCMPPPKLSCKIRVLTKFLFERPICNWKSFTNEQICWTNEHVRHEQCWTGWCQFCWLNKHQTCYKCYRSFVHQLQSSSYYKNLSYDTSVFVSHFIYL